MVDPSGSPSVPPPSDRSESVTPGPAGPHIPASERMRVVSRLTSLRETGDLRRTHMRRAAAALGVSERTVYRWVGQGNGQVARAPRPDRYILSETDWQAYEDFRGNVAAVHRTRAAVLAGHDACCGVPIAEHLRVGWRGAPPVSERTLQTAFAREATTSERAYWRHGEKARRDRLIWPARWVQHRNAIWQVDHTNLKIIVVPPRGKPLRPWLTSFADCYSRVILGWAISLRPHTGIVLAALRSALLCDEQEGGAGGIPALIECDRGAEFTSHALARTLESMVIDLRHPGPPGDGRGNGRIERFHDTIASMLLCTLPGYTGGPRDAAGRLSGPIRDDARWRAAVPDSGRHADGTPVALPLTAFTRIFADWVRWFNAEHRHSALGGATPLSVWHADPTPVRTVPATHLRDLLLVRTGATITGHGIQRDYLHYVAPELQGMGGTRVDIRYAPHDYRFIEVYSRTGQFLATATPADAATPEQTEDYKKARQAEATRLAARRRRANDRAQRGIAALTSAATRSSAEPGSPGVDTAETRLVSVHAAAAHPRRRRRGSASLLGLHETRVLPDPPTGIGG